MRNRSDTRIANLIVIGVLERPFEVGLRLSSGAAVKRRGSRRSCGVGAGFDSVSSCATHRADSCLLRIAVARRFTSPGSHPVLADLYWIWDIPQRRSELGIRRRNAHSRAFVEGEHEHFLPDEPAPSIQMSAGPPSGRQPFASLPDWR